MATKCIRNILFAFTCLVLNVAHANADQYIVTVDELNVREYASSSKWTKVIGKLKRGDVVDVEETNDSEWFSIDLSIGNSFEHGYVFSKYLSKDTTEDREDNLSVLPYKPLSFLKGMASASNTIFYNHAHAQISTNGRFAIFLKDRNIRVFDLKLERIIFEDVQDSADYQGLLVSNNYLIYEKNSVVYSYKLVAGGEKTRLKIPTKQDFVTIFDSDIIVGKTNANILSNVKELISYDLQKNQIIGEIAYPNTKSYLTDTFESRNKWVFFLNSTFEDGKSKPTDAFVFNYEDQTIDYFFTLKNLNEFLKDGDDIKHIKITASGQNAIIFIDNHDNKINKVVSYSLNKKVIDWRKVFYDYENMDLLKINYNEGYIEISTNERDVYDYSTKTKFNLNTGSIITQQKIKNDLNKRKLSWKSNNDRNSISLISRQNTKQRTIGYEINYNVGNNKRVIKLPNYELKFTDITDNGLFRVLINDNNQKKQHLYEWSLKNANSINNAPLPHYIRWVSIENENNERAYLTGVSGRKPGRFATAKTRRITYDNPIHIPPQKPNGSAGNKSYRNCFVSDTSFEGFNLNSHNGLYASTGDGCIISSLDDKYTSNVILQNYNILEISRNKFGRRIREDNRKPYFSKYNCAKIATSNFCQSSFYGNHSFFVKNSVGHFNAKDKAKVHFAYSQNGSGFFEMFASSAESKKDAISIVSINSDDLILESQRNSNIRKDFYIISHSINEIEFIYTTSNYILSHNGNGARITDQESFYLVYDVARRAVSKRRKINNLAGFDTAYKYNDNIYLFFRDGIHIFDSEFNFKQKIPEININKTEYVEFWDNLLVATVSPVEHRVYNIDDGALQGSFFVDVEGNAVALTPSGFFSENNAGAASSIVIQNKDTGNALPLSAVFDDLYRPDLVQEALRGDPDGKVKEATKKLNLASVVGSGAAPEIQKVEFEGDPNSSSITAKYEAVTQDGGAGQVIWRLNGVVVGVEDLNSNSNSGEVIQGKRRVPLVKGENVVSVQITNSKQSVYSNEVSDTIVADPQKDVKPQLFVLALGVNEYQAEELKLNFSVPDALAIVDSLAQKSDQYDEVIVHKLLDGEVTKEAIADKFAEISEAIEPDDTFVFYLAGHGITHEGKFYFLPADVNVEDGFEYAIQKYGVSQNDWRSYLSGISALKSLVLFDACESGSAIRLDASHALEQSSSIDRLARASGRAIITASSETQYALEGYEGHGAFTYTLLQAFENGDDNSDNQLQLSEIAKYVKRELPKITEEKWSYKQEPQVALSGADFPLAQVGR